MLPKILIPVNTNESVNTATQIRALANHFLAGHTLTALEADRFPFFITQFHARKFELEQMGFEFESIWEKNLNTNKRYKRYKLANLQAAKHLANSKGLIS